MEDMNKTEGEKEGVESCNCMMCKAHGMMHGKMCCGWKGRRYIFLRIIILLIIVGIVFSLGVKLGELKSKLYGFNSEKGYYGRQMMMRPGMNYNRGIAPVYGNSLQQSSTTPR